MKRKLLVSALILSMILTFMPSAVFGAENTRMDKSGDTGTPDTSWWENRVEGQTEFTISTPDELAGLIKLSNDNDKSINGDEIFGQITINLGADIDMGIYSGSYRKENGEYVFESTENYDSLNGGTIHYSNFLLDGNGHKISNYCFSTNSSRCSFIRGTSNTGSVKNLRFENCSAISSKNSKNNAIVVGQSRGSIENVTVKDCFIYGTSDYSGGITGRNSGVITNCHVENVTVHGHSYVGIFDGYTVSDGSSPNPSIEENTAVNVSVIGAGSRFTGGISGSIQNAGKSIIIKNNSVSGAIKLSGKDSGMLAGYITDTSKQDDKVELSGNTVVGNFTGTEDNNHTAVGGADVKYISKDNTVIRMDEGCGTVIKNIDASYTLTCKAGYTMPETMEEESKNCTYQKTSETTAIVMPNLTSEEDHIAYVKVKPAEYNIKYITNGGSLDSTAPEKHIYGTDTPLHSPSRTGYTFDGWYTTEDFANESKVETLASKAYTDDITVYAKWTPNLYTIDFDANGGNGNMDSITANYDETVQLSKNTFINGGKTFAGWHMERDAQEAIYADGSEVANLTDVNNGKITLYAIWTEKQVLEPEIESSQKKGYNGSTQSFSMEEGYEITYSKEGQSVDAPVDAGTYEVTIHKDETDTTAEYNLVLHEGLIIEKAHLTVTANSKEIMKGDALPAFDYTTTGWKGSDTDSLLTGVSAVCENSDSNTAGTYPITVTGPEEIDNYKIAYVNGTLTVSEKSSGGGIIIPPSGDHVVHNPSSDTTTADINVSVNADGTAKVTVSESLADQIVTNAIRNQAEEVVLDATTYGSRAKAAEVKLPAEAIKELLSETDAELTVKTDAATLHLDRETMKQISEKAESGSITFSIEKEKEETNALYLDLHITAEQGEVTDFGRGTAEITVKLPYALYDKEVTAVYIDDKGIYEKIGGVKNKDNTFTFTTDHFSSYAVMETAEADKIIKAQTDEKNARLIKGVKNTTIKLSYKKNEIGKGWIKLRYKKSYGYKVDNYEIFRSAKKKTNFGKKPWFVTKTNKTSGYYKNGKSVKKGTRYYYKMRGMREIAGETYYTKWSNTVMRTGR